jgi:hypothetical protein
MGKTETCMLSWSNPVMVKTVLNAFSGSLYMLCVALTSGLNQSADKYSGDGEPCQPAINEYFIVLAYRKGGLFVYPLVYQTTVNVERIKAVLQFKKCVDHNCRCPQIELLSSQRRLSTDFRPLEFFSLFKACAKQSNVSREKITTQLYF